MPLEPQGFASAHAEFAAAAVVAADVVPVGTLLREPFPAGHLDMVPAEHSPPDLTVLHSTFLI